jgi:hypothetical protein
MASFYAPMRAHLCAITRQGDSAPKHGRRMPAAGEAHHSGNGTLIGLVCRRHIPHQLPAVRRHVAALIARVYQTLLVNISFIES